MNFFAHDFKWVIVDLLQYQVDIANFKHIPFISDDTLIYFGRCMQSLIFAEHIDRCPTLGESSHVTVVARDICVNVNDDVESTASTVRCRMGSHKLFVGSRTLL